MDRSVRATLHELRLGPFRLRKAVMVWWRLEGRGTAGFVSGVAVMVAKDGVCFGSQRRDDVTMRCIGVGGCIPPAPSIAPLE